ncbi:hypothetical protein [Draconibacterium mangrovi]|uniref:hypothetical protein n=1 Tax=Draconibacterium mangrovi TaxID=2697469 RepID=UPI0013D4F164|nr:hypothetical protein [Draconibacterium mangrovi]
MKPEELKSIKSKEANVKTSGKPEVKLEAMAERTPTSDSRREIRRNHKDYEQLTSEARSQGLDLNNVLKQPLNAKTKKDLSISADKIYSEDLATSVKGLSEAFGEAPQEPLPDIDYKDLQESARKQRRARWADALYAFGEGLQGRTANPNAMVGTKYQRQRDQQFQNYKSTVERNRKAKELWDQRRNNEILNWILERKNDQTLTATEREKYRLLEAQINSSNRKTVLGENELAARKDNSYYNTKSGKTTQNPVYTQQLDNGSWQLSSGKTPYTDLLYSMTDAPDELFPDPGNRRYTPAEKEDMAKQIISQAFQLSTDKNGNTIARPIEGRESYVQDIPVRQEVANLDELISITEKDLAFIQERYDGASRREKTQVKEELDQKQKELDQIKTNRSNLQSRLKTTLKNSDHDNTKSDEYNSFWNGTKKESTFSEIVKKHQQPAVNSTKKLEAFFE